MPTRSIQPPIVSVPVGYSQSLKNLDVDGDGQIARADFPQLSDAQFKAVMMTLSAMSQRFESEAPADLNLSGKRILFSALKGMKKSEAARLATSVGATVASSLNSKVDVLVVGDRDKTTKDEKAIRMNASGKAEIILLTQGAFDAHVARDTAPIVKLGDDDGSGPRTVIETETWDEETGVERIVAASVKTEIVERANEALKDFIRDYFADAADYFDSPAEFEAAVQGTDVSGFLVTGDDDPIGYDLETEFVFTAYNDELTGDHALFVSVDKQTGEITGVNEFN